MNISITDPLGGEAILSCTSQEARVLTPQLLDKYPCLSAVRTEDGAFFCHQNRHGYFPVTEDKKRYLPLLLLADEQESCIDRYLSRGELLAHFDGQLRAVCVVTREDADTWEIQNLAVMPDSQKKGYGRAMVREILRRFRPRRLLVQTGDSLLTLPFYEACGFRVYQRIADYFPRHYDHPIWENGVLLRDAVRLEMYP